MRPVRAACTKRHRKALKLLDFGGAQKRLSAVLTPRTPKMQAHDRVTELRHLHLADVGVFLKVIENSAYLLYNTVRIYTRIRKMH